MAGRENAAARRTSTETGGTPSTTAVNANSTSTATSKTDPFMDQQTRTNASSESLDTESQESSSSRSGSEVSWKEQGDSPKEQLSDGSLSTHTNNLNISEAHPTTNGQMEADDKPADMVSGAITDSLSFSSGVGFHH